VNSLLAVRDVSVVFGGIIALNGVSFDMHKGAILGLIGPNGAGKTTLFNCLSRLYQPSSRDILMDGLSILTRPPHRIAEIGIVRTFQNVALCPNLSVVDNVPVGCHSRSSSDIISDSIKLAWVRRGEAAGTICFGFGVLFGKPAPRLSDVNLALATFALAGAMPQLLKLGFFEHWTGGVQGLVVTKPDVPFGLPMGQDMWLYYFTLVTSIRIYIASVNLLRSRSGRAFTAIRDNEIAASAMGVDVAIHKTLAFGRLGRHHRRGRRSRCHRGAVRGTRRLHHHARDLAVSRHGGRRRRLAAWIDRRFRLHHFVPNIAESISKGLSGAVFGVLLFLVIFLAPHGAKQVVAGFGK
jgi:ABC-type Fe3+/spermidine/putrescine transport system ATPase subunit